MRTRVWRKGIGRKDANRSRVAGTLQTNTWLERTFSSGLSSAPGAGGKHARERTGNAVKWQLARTGAPSILITIWLNLKTNQPDQPDSNKNKLFLLQAIVNSCPRLDVLFKAKGSFVLVKISKLFSIAGIWKSSNIKEGYPAPQLQLQGKFSATRNHAEASA